MPTAGLDPGERNRCYNVLAEIGEQVIGILSTHIVEDVRRTWCTKTAISDKGQVLYQVSLQDAIGEWNGRIWQISIAKTELARLREALPGGSPASWSAVRPLCHVYSTVPLSNGFGPSAPDLEDVFFTKIRSWIREKLLCSGTSREVWKFASAFSPLDATDFPLCRWPG